MCPKKNRALILWPITLTNFDQYQCHLIKLFLQHYLIIYRKNYSHNRVPAATVTMATSALVQTNICANCALSKYLFQRTGPSCTCHRRVFAPGYTWFHFSWPIWPPNSPNLNPVDYRIWGCLQDCVYQKRTRDINKLKQHLVDVWTAFWQTVIDGAID